MLYLTRRFNETSNWDLGKFTINKHPFQLGHWVRYSHSIWADSQKYFQGCFSTNGNNPKRDILVIRLTGFVQMLTKPF